MPCRSTSDRCYGATENKISVEVRQKDIIAYIAEISTFPAESKSISGVCTGDKRCKCGIWSARQRWVACALVWVGSADLTDDAGVCGTTGNISSVRFAVYRHSGEEAMCRDAGGAEERDKERDRLHICVT